MNKSVLIKLYLTEFFSEENLAYLLTIFLTNFIPLYVAPTTIDLVGAIRTYYARCNFLHVRKVLGHIPDSPSNFNDKSNIRQIIDFADSVRCITSDKIRPYELGVLIDLLCNKCRATMLTSGALKTKDFLNCQECKARIKKLSSNIFYNVDYSVLHTKQVNEFTIQLLNQELTFWNFLFIIFVPTLLLINQLANLLPAYFCRTNMLNYVLLNFFNYQFFITLYLIGLLPTLLVATVYLEFTKFVFLYTITRRFKAAKLPVPPFKVWGSNLNIWMSILFIMFQYSLQILSITRVEEEQWAHYAGKLVDSLRYLLLKNNKKYIATYLTPNKFNVMPQNVHQWCLYMDTYQQELLLKPVKLHIFKSTCTNFVYGFFLTLVLIGFYTALSKERYKDPQNIAKNYRLSFSENVLRDKLVGY